MGAWCTLGADFHRPPPVTLVDTAYFANHIAFVSFRLEFLVSDVSPYAQLQRVASSPTVGPLMASARAEFQMPS